MRDPIITSSTGLCRGNLRRGCPVHGFDLSSLDIKTFRRCCLSLLLPRMEWENSLAFSPYNDHFRTYRKNTSRIIGSRGLASQFNELQEAEVGHFLLHVLDKPETLVEHIKKSVPSFLILVFR